MAGLIAGADIMFSGRTPHPYHTRPGMVSRSNDRNPHGKSRVDTAGGRPRLPVRMTSDRNFGVFGDPVIR
jgi:hypothetical protein